MPARPSPTLPTPAKVREHVDLVRELFPGARVKRIGPDGVEFDYPAETIPAVSTKCGEGRSSRAAR